MIELFHILNVFDINTAYAAGEAVQAAAPVAHAATETAADSSIVGMFGLNWKLFLAQLVNFSIILFVLWKWVFTPVTNALSARTARIEKSLQDVENVDVQKEEFQKWQASAMAEARSEASKIVAKAAEDAEKVRAEILEKAKTDQATVVENGKRQLAEEQAKMINEAKIKLAGIVVNATEKILKEKLDPKKDKEIVASSLKEALG